VTHVFIARLFAVSLVAAIIVAGLQASAWANPGAAQPQIGDLLVNVTTDSAVYQSGDSVAVTVETRLDGALSEAVITKAILTITLPNGQTIKNDIRKDFVMVSPGVFASSGMVKAPGPRTLEITAKVTQRVGCQCKKVTVSSQGFVGYTVEAEALEVAIGVDNQAPSLCDTVEVSVLLDRRAHIQLVAIFPNGAQRNLVIPGWVQAGETRIEVGFKSFDIGEVIIKVTAQDHYGQIDMATVGVNVGFGVCDC